VNGLEGKRALVTGGTSGIGQGIVERLRTDGASVVFTGRDEGRGQRVAEATGAAFVRADASDPDAVGGSVDEALATLGGLDVLVNNAGMILQGSLEATPPDAWRELLAVNLTAGFLYSKACFGPLRDAGGGSIVHIASDTAIRGIWSIAAYSVTKAGVRMLSDMLALDGAAVNVRSNAVCPGDVQPGVQATPAGFADHAEDQGNWTLPPAGRFGEASDVAGLVAWLASDAARHVSGATIRIDAGMGAGISG
jgi:NAD(P)-dependent dehydrogenase (short-subunit alcohol dehydrogenase family)